MSPTAELTEIAKRVAWWKQPAEAISSLDDFLCRVMTFGLWSDACTILNIYGEKRLRKALNHAPPGIFDNPSWHYWNYRLGATHIPKLPTRHLP